MLEPHSLLQSVILVASAAIFVDGQSSDEAEVTTVATPTTLTTVESGSPTPTTIAAGGATTALVDYEDAYGLYVMPAMMQEFYVLNMIQNFNMFANYSYLMTPVETNNATCIAHGSEGMDCYFEILAGESQCANPYQVLSSAIADGSNVTATTKKTVVTKKVTKKGKKKKSTTASARRKRQDSVETCDSTVEQDPTVRYTLYFYNLVSYNGNGFINITIEGTNTVVSISGDGATISTT